MMMMMRNPSWEACQAYSLRRLDSVIGDHARGCWMGSPPNNGHLAICHLTQLMGSTYLRRVLWQSNLCASPGDRIRCTEERKFWLKGWGQHSRIQWLSSSRNRHSVQHGMIQVHALDLPHSWYGRKRKRKENEEEEDKEFEGWDHLPIMATCQGLC